jgi:hypothetical protein
MKLKKQMQLIVLYGLILGLSGCYGLVFKPGDMKNVRQQFHLPKSVTFLSFDSTPKTPGFFGREGLRITATVEFTQEEFETYVAHLNDSEVWQPVPYLNYSPSSADEYSPAALQWNDLPLPSTLEDRFHQIGFTPKGIDVQHGKYYCSVLLAIRGEPLEHNPAAYHWRYVGKSCAELSTSEFPTIRAFAVLDHDKILLHVHLQFSG